jgi:hypothetical protein
MIINNSKLSWKTDNDKSLNMEDQTKMCITAYLVTIKENGRLHIICHNPAVVEHVLVH